MLTRLRIFVADESAARRVAERLAEPDGEGTEALATSSFQDASGDRWQIDAYYSGVPSLIAVLARIGDLLMPGQPPVLEDVPDENWVAVSQAALPPVEAGRFLVYGSHDRSRVGRRRFAIEIDAGEAFGTAHHATTQGCLRAVDRLARRRSFSRILDLVCGSGVLAIAAARVWPAARIIASDMDLAAVDVARMNAKLNGVRGRMRLVNAAGLAHGTIADGGPFELVLANILAGPLIRLAPRIARETRPGGVVVLSGLLGEQAREVSAVYAMAGFRLDTRDLRHNWATLTLVKSARTTVTPCDGGRHHSAGRIETRRNLPDWAQDQ